MKNVKVENALSGFRHRIGVHCSSTSIRDVLDYDGIEMSEAMVFGLGSGLGFFYFNTLPKAPQFRFNGRSSLLERRFYKRIGKPVTRAGEWNPEKMAEAILVNKRPILAITDLVYLPYYEPVHFPGHGIVIIGIDMEQQGVCVADIAYPEFQSLHFDHLHSAIAVQVPPLMIGYHWAETPHLTPEYIKQVVNPETIRGAILETVGVLTHPEHPYEGFARMELLAYELPRWAELTADWEWAARFAYQSIEKRGTGGSAFRVLYADFLDEAAEYLPVLNTLNASQRLRDSATIWSQIGTLCKTVFSEKNPTYFDQMGELVRNIHTIEQALMNDLSVALRQ